jgi:hypothetical protein
MATRIQTKLPQPIFHEPIFNEDGSLRDPTGFSIQHPSDNALYKRIGDLLKKSVVPIPQSRSKRDDIFGLGEAYGSVGPEIIKQITQTGNIVFHAFGDSGASNTRKYANELRVADQVTVDTASSPQNGRAHFSIILATWFIISARRDTITINFTSRSAIILRRFSQFRATTIHSSFRAPSRKMHRLQHSSVISAHRKPLSRLRQVRCTGRR